MPMWFWYALAAWLGILALGAGYLIYRDALRQRQIANARARLNRATVTHIETQRALGTFERLVADAAASDYAAGDLDTWSDYVDAAIDLASATPIHDELAVEHLRRDLDQWGREGA